MASPLSTIVPTKEQKNTRKDILKTLSSFFLKPRQCEFDKFRQLFGGYLEDPLVRTSTFLPILSSVLGAGAGAYLGHKMREDDDNTSKDTAKILTGATLGGAVGGFAGTTIKDKVRWAKLRRLSEELNK